jgi:hypothetical protein
LIAGIEQALPEDANTSKGLREWSPPQSRAGDHRASVWQPWGLRDVAPLRGRDELVAEVINHVIGDSAVRPLDS